jgi:predicted GIY-YIG superfamily endonuclease
MVMAFWIYLLRCRDGSYYTGHTDDLERRIAEHDCGTIPCYTHDRRPLHMMFSQDFAPREEALAMERRLKGWSRAKKEALIDGDWEMINRLGRGKHARQRAEPA